MRDLVKLARDLAAVTTWFAVMSVSACAVVWVVDATARALSVGCHP